MVAALYVDTRWGPYGLLGVDCWNQKRDARLYDGPLKVVAHPSCAWWGGLPAAWATYSDCGPRAVEQVRKWGGVLEHPAYSRLWPFCGLPKPGEDADEFGGRTIVVFQVDWGHPCQKKTWLYFVGIGQPPAFPSPKASTYCVGNSTLPELRKKKRHLTPIARRDL